MEQYSKVKLLKTEAFILKTYPFRDYDLIVSVFSFEFGLLKGIIRGAKSKRKGLVAYLAPASKVELIFKESSKELKAFNEVSPLKHTEPLRKNLNQINAVLSMVSNTLKALALEKPAPELYELFELFLKELERTNTPEKIAATYTLKLLNHEGYFSELLFQDHESFSEEEIKVLFALTLTKNLKQLHETPLSPKTRDKIEQLFTSIYL